jgi:hypothetical protein
MKPTFKPNLISALSDSSPSSALFMYSVVPQILNFSPSMTSGNLFSMLVPLLLFLQAPSVLLSSSTVTYTSLLLQQSKVYPDGGQVSVYPTADTSLNCLYEKDTAVQDPLVVVDVPHPSPILTPPVVPPLVSAAAIIQHAVDPVTTITTTDPVLLRRLQSSTNQRCPRCNHLH